MWLSQALYVSWKRSHGAMMVRDNIHDAVKQDDSVMRNMKGKQRRKKASATIGQQPTINCKSQRSRAREAKSKD
nr:hypothetical protein I308_02975 [Cryptococcus tetragattii IND107]